MTPGPSSIINGLRFDSDWIARNEETTEIGRALVGKILARHADAVEAELCVQSKARRGLLLSFADRVEQAEPWLHKGVKFTKWAKDLARDLREAAEAAP